MGNKFLRVHDVCALIGVGRTTLYALEKKGGFPKRISLIGKSVAWNEAEIIKWMEERMAARGCQQATANPVHNGAAK